MNNWELTKDEEFKNRKLEKAIQEYNLDENEDTLAGVLTELMDRMSVGGQVDVPVALSDEFKREFDNQTDGMTFNLDLRTIEDDEGNDWVPLFTNAGAAKSGGKTDLIAYDIADIIKQIVDIEDINGAIIDPWTTPFEVDRGAINMLLSVIDNTEGGALNLIQGDIVTMDVQAIVNPSNNMLTAAPDDDSINGLIHRAAGPGLDAECRTLHGIATGEAKITDGYDLQAEYVIHTAGPIYSGKPSDEEELAECYENALDLARTHGITSIALPCISTGAFGYPAEDAADIAIPTVLEWISDNDDYDLNVTFCVHDEDTYDMYKGFLDQIFDSSDTDEQ